MNNQKKRDWKDLSEKDLNYIIDHDPDKRLVRIAKTEKKKRKSVELRHVGNPGSQTSDMSQVEIIGINLTFKNWFQVALKAYAALVLAVFVLSIPILILYMVFASLLFSIFV